MGQFITLAYSGKKELKNLPWPHLYPLHVLPPLAEFPVVTNDSLARLRTCV